MDFMKEFNRIMNEQLEVALATSVDNIPNVRIVNFYYDEKNKGILYFSTFKENNKILEFERNNQTSFTTIPQNKTEHVRVRNSVVKKSSLSIFDLKDEFSTKIPGYESTINDVGDYLELYELHFDKATVTLDYNNCDTISLT